MKIKRIMALALAVCLFALCGCGEKSEKKSEKAEKKEKKPYVIMVNALNGIPVYDQQAEAAKKAAEDYGIKLEITGPEVGKTDAGVDAVIKDYKAAMEDAISKKPDAIICEPFDPEIYDSVEAAHKAGIPVFCTSNGTEDKEQFIACCGTDNEEYGKKAADLMAEKTGGSASVLVVVSSETVPTQAAQLEAFKKQCSEKYPDIKVAAVASDDADLPTAEAVFKENFTVHPDVNAVLMLESVGSAGAVTVAKEMGREICILDIDTSKEKIDNITSGAVWATLAQNYYKRGYEVVRMAYEYITNDGKVEYGEFKDSSAVLITAENAADYEKILWDNVCTKGKEW